MKEKRSGFDVKAATKLLNRVFRYMLHYYAVPFVIVIACIIATAVATVIGATFPQKLVDEYIMPMLASGSNDFSGLAADMTDGHLCRPHIRCSTGLVPSLLCRV